MSVEPSTTKRAAPDYEALRQAAATALQLAREGVPPDEDDPFRQDRLDALADVDARLRRMGFPRQDHDDSEPHRTDQANAWLAAACAAKHVTPCSHLGPWPAVRTIALDLGVELCAQCTGETEPLVLGQSCAWCGEPPSYGASTYFVRTGTVAAFGTCCMRCAKAMS